jgi:hypothetical protein
MPDRIFIARLFLIGGGLLAIAGLLLGFILPIAPMFPPYLVTASLALGYGIVSLRSGRPASRGVTKP